jgi:hypothetical protein
MLNRQLLDVIQRSRLRGFQFYALGSALTVVGDLVHGDPVEPADKGKTPLLVATDPSQRPDEDIGSQIFSDRPVLNPGIHEAIDAVYVRLVQLAEGVRVSLCSLDQVLLVQVSFDKDARGSNHGGRLGLYRRDFVTETADFSQEGLRRRLPGVMIEA